MPLLVNEQYSVTYSASADAFLFDFVTAGIQTYTIRRVGFTYALSNAAPDAVTFYSNLSSDYIQFDGLTVRSSNCTSPVGASPLDLYNAILALYVVGPPVVPTELQSFRHGAEKQTLKTGSGDPSYVDWYQIATTQWDYDRNSEARFDFPDQQTVIINQAGVYEYDIVVAARADSSGRAWTMFLDTSGGPIASEPDNPQLGAISQVAYPPTWQGSQTLTSCVINGKSWFDAGTQIRIAYTTESDLTTVEQYTFLSMEYRPEVLNAGPQGDQGLPGNDGAPGADGTDGADGVVQAITGTAPIVVGGTAANPVISHSLLGTSNITLYPYNLARDAFGHIISMGSMTAPYNQIVVSGLGLSLGTGGAAPTRTATITHIGAGAAAGVYNNIVSITLNSTNHVSSILTGFPAERTNNKDQPNGYAGLGPFGKIAASQLPAIAITDTFVIGPHADLVTLLDAEVGDIGIVTADADNTLEGSWILQTAPYATLSNWVRLIPPTAAGVVYTVNGLLGPNVILGAGAITSGTLPAAQLPALSATGDATGTGTAGTGSIPLTLTPTGVGAVSVTNANLTIGVDGRIYAASNGSTGAAGTMLRSFYGPTDDFSNPTAAVVTPFTFPVTRATGTRTYTGAEVASGLHIRFTSQIDAGTSPSVVLYMEYNGGFLPLATLDSSTTQGMSIDVDAWTSTDDNTTVTNQALWTSAVRYSVNNIINGTARLISQGPVHYTNTIAAVAATSYTFTPQILWTTSSGATAGTSKGYMTIDRY